MDTKKKLRINADLNFVSSYSLEQIIDGVECISSKNIRARTIPIDDNQYLIQMEYQREGRAMALLDGRLQRWAGDMTHIYCYGGFARYPLSKFYREFALLGWAAWVGVSLVIFSPGEFNMNFVWAISTAAYLCFLHYIYPYVKKRVLAEVTIIHNDPTIAEHRDLELLLDALADIIADPVEAQCIRISEKDDPLAREEIEQLLAAHNTNSRRVLLDRDKASQCSTLTKMDAKALKDRSFWSANQSN